MKIYNLEKEKIGYELCYNNSIGSKLYARVRINALQLEEHKGRGKENYNSTCKLCGEELEDIVHFIAKCKYLDNKRNYDILNKDIADPEERTKDILYRNKNHNDIGIMIRIMWETRRKALEPSKKNKSPRTCPHTGPHARDLVLSNCLCTSPNISHHTGPHAETSFSPIVLVQLTKTS